MIVGKQREQLEAMIDLMISVMDEQYDHKVNSTYLGVAGEYCLELADNERKKAEIDNQFENRKENEEK